MSEKLVYKQKQYLDLFEEYALRRFGELDETNVMLSPMKYSFFAGGKRIRPLLSFASNETINGDIDRLLPFVFALECIHTYSLIHDDLPAMDNDDYRRGKLTNHKVYGEAVAILAGDALLNLAFSVILQECVLYPDVKTATCAKLLSDFAGFEGMIGGQAVDVLSENNVTANADTLDYISTNKTAKLIAAAIVMPYILSGKNIDNIKDFAFLLGKQFQIVDDILDVESTTATLGKTVGKDAKTKKLTHVSVYGLEGAKNKSKEIFNQCDDFVSKLNNCEYLSSLCKLLYERVK